MIKTAKSPLMKGFFVFCGYVWNEFMIEGINVYLNNEEVQIL